jgi:hypothetical protein
MYFLDEFSQLLRKFGRESYFVAIPVRRRLGYKAVSTKIIDITEAALQAI